MRKPHFSNQNKNRFGRSFSFLSESSPKIWKNQKSRKFSKNPCFSQIRPLSQLPPPSDFWSRPERWSCQINVHRRGLISWSKKTTRLDQLLISWSNKLISWSVVDQLKRRGLISWSVKIDQLISWNDEGWSVDQCRLISWSVQTTGVDQFISVGWSVDQLNRRLLISWF